jgi:hypothetical protein
MSDEIAAYSFLPWLRDGLANLITAKDGDAGVKLRATIPVTLHLTGDGVAGPAQGQDVTRNVALYGPGDIIGIDRKTIIRAEPHHGIKITNFEPNYLPLIEFYDEDLPWRYTPAGADAAGPAAARNRLRPWIALVVLADNEFQQGANVKNRPLPFIQPKDFTVLPDAAELWCWAHVHVNRSLAASDAEMASDDMNAVLPKLQATLNENPDLAYSRLISPRKLAPKTAYHAFVVPVFESGRLAGLGLDPAGAPHATFSAWADYNGRPESLNIPYYHSWNFRTGETGDFESLVRLLKPQPVDKRVGTRDMDVQTPGSNLPGITDPKLKGILKLGGALRVPREDYTPTELIEVDKYDHWAKPYPGAFQSKLADLINLADDYAADAPSAANAASGLGSAVENDPDPLVTPPLYGTWHALTKRLLRQRDGSGASPNDNWVHELNLDPRYRVAAGFGTGVIQKNQETYMDAAWAQIGSILEANHRIRLAQLAMELSWSWHRQQFVPLASASPQKTLMLTAPLHKRVISNGYTVHYAMANSRVQPAMTSAVMRRATRPRGRLMRALPFTSKITPDNLIARANAGLVSAAPPKVTPPGVVTVDDVANQLLPKGVPNFVARWLRGHWWFRWLVLLIGLLLLIAIVVGLPAGWPALAGAAICGWLFWLLSRWQSRIAKSDQLRDDNQSPEAVADLPKSPDFTLSDPSAPITPRFGATDSAIAIRFKAALVDSRTMVAAATAAGVAAPRTALDLPALSKLLVTALDPARTIPAQIWREITIPDRIRLNLPETFVEAMAYPVIDTPMYKPLVDPAELFLPNINLIAQNSVTLLESNQKFIESYMVGLNHEFGRELLWREFPTDQRPSTFRQFWDVGGVFTNTSLDNEALKEKLRDIPPIHKWPKHSALGDHDNRDKEAEVVLVIRGELLKRYPNAVIYAQHAAWPLKDDGVTIDHTLERRLVDITGNESEADLRKKLRTPLYHAQVAPDIYFFGFDLTTSVAKGDPGTNKSEEAGWFFVIKERSGEPRFGLDIDKQATKTTWNDLAWPDVQPGAPGSFIPAKALNPAVTLASPGNDVPDTKEQHIEDAAVHWDANLSAADAAYILFQVPVMVAIHADEMLTKV